MSWLPESTNKLDTNYGVHKKLFWHQGTLCGAAKTELLSAQTSNPVCHRNGTGSSDVSPSVQSVHRPKLRASLSRLGFARNNLRNCCCSTAVPLPTFQYCTPRRERKRPLAGKVYRLRLRCSTQSARGYLSDLIDPRTGYPQLSRPGEIPHDDTAVVQALLGFPVMHNTCSVLEHPSWGSAVYPGILMSSAPPQVIKPALKRVAAQHGWREPKTDLQLSVGVWQCQHLGYCLLVTTYGYSLVHQ